MSTLSKQTLTKKLNKYLVNIIEKYVDYSTENLNNIQDINMIPREIHVKFKNEMTLLDVIVLCKQVGYAGFFVDNFHTTLIEYIDSFLPSCPTVNKSIVENDIFYRIYNGPSQVSSLLYLNVLETSFKLI